MTKTPSDRTPRGPLRAIAGWFRKDAPDTAPTLSPVEGAPARISHFVITGVLGRGGMGVVYSARDERLGREVALKRMSGWTGDEESRQRFWREARLAASVSHPNVCPLYEIGEFEGEPFIAMELLRGESLAQRLERGALPLAEVLDMAEGMLSALAALHERGIIHRDLKPSNIFLTPHGVKLLDFGLARDHAPGGADGLTRTGILIGTPRYMSPEQIGGAPLTAASDLFAVGVILFEALSGRPAFQGANVVEVLHATLHEQPPALAGSRGVASVDRVIRRALAKKPTERPASAAAIAEALRAVQADSSGSAATPTRALTRVVVLPFRVLRPDPDTDFLAISLPDAIATSLTRSKSLIVRSTAVAARFAADTPDFKVLASEVDVDRVVTGTLLRSGDELQATAQLIEAPAGTLVASHAVRSSLGNLFQLQDDIAHRVVEALALPLGDATPPSGAEARVDPRAYELYLRANALGRRYHRLSDARDLYRQAIELDPGFAAAWAQIGRCSRLIGKYVDDSEDSVMQAEEAFRRAYELQPRLSLVHKFYAQHECDTGQSVSAITRLLGEAARNGNDAELFAGLVHALRYGGLLDHSIAAHEEARRLDPHVPTSIEQTLQTACEFDRLHALPRSAESIGGDEIIRVMAYGLAGRYDEARTTLERTDLRTEIPAFLAWNDFLRAWLDRDPDAMRRHRSRIEGVTIMNDPEAVFEEGWMFCDAGDFPFGLARIREGVTRGYSVVDSLRRSRSFDPVREDPAYLEIEKIAEAGRARALAAFREGGGERLLGA